MKYCQNCRYSNDSFQFAGEWWCACSNPSRSVETHFKRQFLGYPVLKESVNLPCWQVDAPSELATIRPHRKSKRISRLSRFYPARNLKIPWSYVFRSKIATLRRKEEASQ